MSARQKTIGTNGQLGLRRSRVTCGFCGFDVTINANGAMRVHGPVNDRCVGSTMRMKASVHAMRRRDPVNGMSVIAETYPHGRCGVCGDISYNVDDADPYLRKHNHRRPRVIREDDQWSVSWFSYGTNQWRRRYADTHDDAMAIVRSIKER